MDGCARWVDEERPVGRLGEAVRGAVRRVSGELFPTHPPDGPPHRLPQPPDGALVSDGHFLSDVPGPLLFAGGIVGMGHPNVGIGHLNIRNDSPNVRNADSNVWIASPNVRNGNSNVRIAVRNVRIAKSDVGIAVRNVRIAVRNVGFANPNVRIAISDVPNGVSGLFQDLKKVS